MFGFTGAHRAGKTTTAKRVAEVMGLEFFDGSFGRLAKLLGYNSVDVMSVERRIEMQEKALALHLAMIQKLPRPCITDRTPLDFLAYAIAEVPMNAGLPEEISQRVRAYAENCIRITTENYGGVTFLRPLPVYKSEDGKPTPCAAYQAHIDHLCAGAVFQAAFSGMPVYRPKTLDLDMRVVGAANFFGETLAGIDIERAEQLVH